MIKALLLRAFRDIAGEVMAMPSSSRYPSEVSADPEAHVRFAVAYLGADNDGRVDIIDPTSREVVLSKFVNFVISCVAYAPDAQSIVVAGFGLYAVSDFGEPTCHLNIMAAESHGQAPG